MSPAKKRIPLWLLGLASWGMALLFISGMEYRRMDRQPQSPQSIDWLGVGLAAAAPAGLVVMISHHLRARPSPEQRAALSAIFNAGPGTIGAVVVTRKGVPEVVATVRSVEEYVELAGSGRLPQDHRVYLPEDLV